MENVKKVLMVIRKSAAKMNDKTLLYSKVSTAFKKNKYQIDYSVKVVNRKCCIPILNQCIN